MVLRRNNIKWREGPLKQVRQIKDRYNTCIGFFVSFPKLPYTLTLYILLILLSPQLASSQPDRIYPPWYNKSTKQVDWEKYPTNIPTTSDPFSTLGRWQWGVCYGADVQGQYAYIGNGDLFQVLDLSDPSNPVIVGELPLGFVNVIKIRGSIAYVIGSRFFTVDISDPEHPRKLGELFLPWPMRVVPTDSFAYVSYFGGLAIVDITDPTNLSIRNSASFYGEFPVGLAVKDRFVYLSFDDYEGLYIFDVSDPDAPLTTYDYFHGFLAGITVDSLLITGSAGIFQIYSISDPNNPVQLCSTRIGPPGAYHIYSITAESTTVFVGTVNAGVFAIDISDLGNPVVRGSFEWPYCTAYELSNTGLGLIGSHLIASNVVGLSIIDRSNIDSLKETIFFPTGGVQTSIEIKDSLAIIGAGMAGMWILDISDPFKPRPVSNIFIPYGFTSDLVVSDTVVYLINSVESGCVYEGRGLWIVNISNIENPEILGHHIGITKFGTYELHKNTIAKEGDLVYLIQTKAASSDSVLEIIDVGDPENPVMLSAYVMPYIPYRMWVQDSIAYLGTSNGGLRIIDCHNPSMPVEISSLLSTARGIALKDSFAFITGTSADLFIYNMSDPSSPSFISVLDMPFGWQAVSEVLVPGDGLLYWASDNTRGIIDISDPENPEILAIEDGEATDVALYGNNLIYTLEDNGMLIVQNNSILHPQSYDLAQGWNLLSLPVNTQSPSISFNFPSAISAYSYTTSGYQTVDSIEPGLGCWLKSDSSESIDIYGTSISSDTLSLSKGWNIIGSVSEPIPVSSIVTDPGGMIVTEFYGYNGGYSISDSILPGKGYWVKLLDSAKMIVSSESSSSDKPFISMKDRLDNANRLIFKDHTGTCQTLYFYNTDSPAQVNLVFELPPPAPAGTFDVRFSPNSLVAALNRSDSIGIPISVRSNHYPVIMQWIFQEFNGEYEILVDDNSIPMGDDEVAQIDKPFQQIVLRMSGIEELPGELSIDQNFPNPFNAQTQIQYTVPQRNPIQITLINILGETVRILKEEVMDPGEYSLKLDLSDLPSGIYFYRIESINVSITRKLSFLK